MQNERRAEAGGWKEKVTGLAHAPGEQPDLEATWLQLRSRLDHAEPARQLWHWYAAASVFLLLLGSLYPSRIHQHAKVVPPMVATTHNPRPAVVLVVAPPKRSPNSAGHTKSSRKLHPAINTFRADPLLASASVEKSVLPDGSVSQRSARSITPQVKQLQVLRLNELPENIKSWQLAGREPGATLSTGSTVNLRQHRSTTISYEPGDHLLKIKISPN